MINNKKHLNRLASIIRESHYIAQNIMWILSLYIFVITIMLLDTFKTNSTLINIAFIIVNIGIIISMQRFWKFHMKFYTESMSKLKDLYSPLDNGESK